MSEDEGINDTWAITLATPGDAERLEVLLNEALSGWRGKIGDPLALKAVLLDHRDRIERLEKQLGDAMAEIRVVMARVT